MKLYRVFNGYMGDTAISILVVANNECRAIEIAREQFKKYSGQYGDSYYSNLSTELVFDNLIDEDFEWLE